MKTTERILVIKLSAFGDFILAMGPFAAIREHHPKAHITLLTTKSFRGIAEKSGLFDDIWLDTKPRIWQLSKLCKLRNRLYRGKFDRVYDLQTSDRSSLYFQLLRLGFLGKKVPEWSGIARGCSHPHANPSRDHMHTVDRQQEQLAMAGIKKTPLADLSFLKQSLKGFDLKKSYVLLVPGGAAHRPEKRWPAESYGQLCDWLIKKGYQPVVVGTPTEQKVTQAIVNQDNRILDLTGKTSLEDLVSLGAGSSGTIGNDSGPTHVFALSGSPTVTLFSRASDPKLCAPHGPKTTYIREDFLKNLSTEKVSKTFQELIK
ncbi:MAG: glycosyltransferase family 9 protein [Alphaproteobacteria bacterium]|jgi:ADP-heptose:LPS heptosyltransferase|nr:glycosyltransferase family 9 protein [Alphaproteobacteria bacterium]MBT5389163.1 glycosyltransferase family 9 protein [Alphaproteobacteria bacterium]MBT5541065.1 glycosyltransferase family 9 protein [Alphaproteobacteria bacterium]MBT5654004.1 glycosyltransferase family 9 protein [Alphaproteobacteria bacterium]